MNILIKGMEMPKNCYNCWLGHKCPKYEALLWNEINKERKDDCPLAPVPKPGRLIDADALIDYCKHFAGVFKGSSLPTDKARRDELLGVIGEIVNAPTIIPAEEGET